MSLRDDIASELAWESQGMTVAQLMVACDTERERVVKALRNMALQGRVERADDGMWSITPEGRARRSAEAVLKGEIVPPSFVGTVQVPRAPETLHPAFINAMQKETEDLARVAFVPTAELDKPAPIETPYITLNVTVPVTTAMKLLKVLEDMR